MMHAVLVYSFGSFMIISKNTPEKFYQAQKRAEHYDYRGHFIYSEYLIIGEHNLSSFYINNDVVTLSDLTNNPEFETYRTTPHQCLVSEKAIYIRSIPFDIKVEQEYQQNLNLIRESKLEEIQVKEKQLRQENIEKSNLK